MTHCQVFLTPISRVFTQPTATILTVFTIFTDRSSGGVITICTNDTTGMNSWTIMAAVFAYKMITSVPYGRNEPPAGGMAAAARYIFQLFVLNLPSRMRIQPNLCLFICNVFTKTFLRFLFYLFDVHNFFSSYYIFYSSIVRSFFKACVCKYRTFPSERPIRAATSLEGRPL